MSIESLMIEKLRGTLSDAAAKLKDQFDFALPKMKGDSRQESSLAASGVANSVQSAYTKAEEIFKHIAKNIDDRTPSGEGWHKEIIVQMSLITPDRDAVIGDDTLAKLKETLSFRHVVRNNYSGDLRIDDVIKNAQICIDALNLLDEDLKIFLHESNRDELKL